MRGIVGLVEAIGEVSETFGSTSGCCSVVSCGWFVCDGGRGLGEEVR